MNKRTNGAWKNMKSNRLSVRLKFGEERERCSSAVCRVVLQTNDRIERMKSIEKTSVFVIRAIEV